MIESASPSSPKIFTKIVAAILVVALADLVYLNWWAIRSGKLRVESGKSENDRSVTLIPPSPSPLDEASPSPSPSAQPKSISKTQTIIQNAQKEIFIPIGSGSTNSDKFTDLTGLEVTIDPAKYGSIESVIFEASLWVDGGNGRAYAQLTNYSDKNPLIESQISNDTASPMVKSSGNVPVPYEAKTYRVQAKTAISNFAAHVENARIKITLK